MKKRRSKFDSFLKGVIIVFSLAILGEGILLFGGKYLGLDVSSLASTSVQALSGVADNFRTGSIDFTAGSSVRKLDGDNGPMEGTGRPQTSNDLSDPVNTGEEYTFDTTTYPYRAILSSEEQEVYNQIYANAYVYNTSTFTLVNSLSEDELCDAMNAVFNDHPELFWLNTSYKYGYSNSGDVVQVQLSYGISSSNLETAKTKFDSAVSEIAEGASAYSTDIEKELYIHDAIADMATYNESASLNQSAYSALVTGKTVCAGYARAFQIVCQDAGLTCYYITGTASGGDHAWNITSVSGDFYNVDLTWDDSISESYGSSVYTYFNLTDSAISVDHTRSTLSSNLPKCTATDMAYTNVYGETVEIDDIENDNDSQITDGDFTINEPQEPVVDWRDEPTPSAPSSQDSQTVPQNNQQPSQQGQNGNQQEPQNTQPTMQNNQTAPQNMSSQPQMPGGSMGRR